MERLACCTFFPFFPFLNTTAQPNPEPEPAAVQKTRQRAETATPGHSDHLPGPDPVPQPQAPASQERRLERETGDKARWSSPCKKRSSRAGAGLKQQPKQGEPQANGVCSSVEAARGR